MGLPLTLKWNEGFQADAWKVDVKNVHSEYGLIDTRSFDFLTHKYLEITSPEVQAVLPLLTKEDAYLAPLFDTELFKFLISYNTTWEFDQIYDHAYINLLGDSYLLALKNKDQVLADRILATVEALKDTRLIK